MPRPFKPSILTANHLLDGDVIYWQGGVWVRALADAEVFTAQADAELALGAVSESVAVGAYLTEIKLESGKPASAHFRESFRATGPSNYFHGKQADVSL